jgi:hypothetical protein
MYFLIIGVIFGNYLFYFISGFMNSFFKDPTARFWADAIVGAILLFLVLNV